MRGERRGRRLEVWGADSFGYCITANILAGVKIVHVRVAVKVKLSVIPIHCGHMYKDCTLCL